MKEFDIHLDPEKSIKYNASNIQKFLGDSELAKSSAERLGVDQDEMYKKLIPAIEEFIQQGKFSRTLNEDVLVGFLEGFIYSMAATAKMMHKMSQNTNGMDGLKIMVSVVSALHKGIENVKNDKWLENLLKNAKIEPEPSKPKKNDNKK